MSGQLDMVLLGSGWVDVFGEEAGANTISGNVDNLLVTSSSPSSGISIKATSHGVQFPKLVSKSATPIKKNDCVLFVAQNFDRDFMQFQNLTQNHDGYIVLIVKDEAHIDRWEKMVKNQARLFHTVHPMGPTDAQMFVASCVNKICLYEKLKAAEMVF